MKLAKTLAPLGALLLLSTALSADVIVVGPGPGEIPELDDGIMAAAEGDTILVRSGRYDRDFPVISKSLTILGEDGAVIEAWPEPLCVEDLAADQTVVFRNIDFERGGGSGSAAQVLVRDCAGAVLFEDCVMQLSALFSGTLPVTGVAAYDSASVTLVNCEVFSGRGDTAPGLLAERSRLFVYDTVARGSRGSNGEFFANPAEDGGAGLLLLGASEAYLQGVTLFGGRGGDGSLCNTPSAPGGAGVSMQYDGVGSPVLRHRESSFSGGPGGMKCGISAPDGLPLDVLSGTVYAFDEPARRFTTAAQTVENAQLAVSFEGQEGDLVGIVLAADALAPAMPLGNLLDRQLHVAAPFFITTLGTLPASGQLATSGKAPNLIAPIEDLQITTQGLFVSLEGDLFLSGPSVATVVVN